MSADKTLLAADIGGTKTLLCLARLTTDSWEIVDQQQFSSRDYARFEDVLRQFLADRPAPYAACLGIAGPIHHHNGLSVAKVTNLPWLIDEVTLSQTTGIGRWRLINDFQAMGYALDRLGADELVTLQQGLPQAHGVRALIGAGTGLGHGFLVWQGDHYEVYPSEGGHTDFAAADAQQDRLLQRLRGMHPHVSWERVVSGPGIAQLFEFLLADTQQEPSESLLRLLQNGDTARAISEAAMFGADSLAEQTLNLFIRLYGAQAGNLALTVLAHGGVYIGGGIAPKILPKLLATGFLEAFCAKGRMKPLLQRMPVKVIVNAQAGLTGALAVARRLATTPSS